MSDTPQKSNNNRRRRNNNRRYNKGGGQGNKSAQGNKTPGNKSGGNNNRRYANKNRRPKTLTPARIMQKYDNLLEQYLVARKKFNDVHGRGKERQLEKVQKNYQQALKSLRDFENGLLDWQREVLKGKIDAYPADRQFTTEHNLEPKGDEVSFVGEFEDPHLLPTQKDHQWTEDSEETEGTMDDYYAYKGITPPTPAEKQ